MSRHDWPEQPLGTVATVNPRRDPELRSHCDQLRVTFVPMAAVDEVSGTITKPTVKVLGEVRSGFTPFREDDVIFAKITPCMQNGKSAVAKNLLNGLGFGSTEFHVVRPGRTVLSKWMWYFVRQRSVLEDAQQHFRGSAGQKRVPPDFLQNLMVPVPSVAEQCRVIRRIDECMDRIDEIRKLSSEAAMEAAALLPSSLAATFAELRGTFPTATVGHCLVESRYGTSRRCDAGASAVPVLRIPNVARGRISVDNLKYCELGNKELERFRIDSGDILVVRTNGSPDLVGRCAVHVDNNRSFAFASYLIRLRVDPAKILPGFLMFFLTSTMGRDAIAAIRRTSAGQFNINVQNLRRIRLPLPPLAIQAEVVDRLTDQRNVTAAIGADQTTHATDADLLINAVLRRAFSGDL